MRKTLFFPDNDVLINLLKDEESEEYLESNGTFSKVGSNPNITPFLLPSVQTEFREKTEKRLILRIVRDVLEKYEKHVATNSTPKFIEDLEKTLGAHSESTEAIIKDRVIAESKRTRNLSKLRGKVEGLYAILISQSGAIMSQLDTCDRFRKEFKHIEESEKAEVEGVKNSLNDIFLVKKKKEERDIWHIISAAIYSRIIGEKGFFVTCDNLRVGRDFECSAERAKQTILSRLKADLSVMKQVRYLKLIS